MIYGWNYYILQETLRKTNILKLCQNVATIYLTQINHNLIDGKQLALYINVPHAWWNRVFTKLVPYEDTWNCGTVLTPEIIWSWCWHEKKPQIITNSWSFFSPSNINYLFTWSASMHTRKIHYFYLMQLVFYAWITLAKREKFPHKPVQHPFSKSSQGLST